jgi:sugar phosphate permease
MLGKFMLGLPTDYFGGEKALHITLLLSAAFLFGCSISSTIYTFGAFWIAFSFVFSAGWGAIGKIIRENFLEKEWAAQLGLVYTGSRVGSILSVLLFGGILRRSNLPRFSSSGWRNVFRASSAILTAVLAMSNVLTRPTDIGSVVDPLVDGKSSRSRSFEQHIPAKRNNHDGNFTGKKENVSQIVTRFVTKESFWLVLASKISFVSVRQFSTFLPFYLTTGYAINPSTATFSSASFAVRNRL